MTAAQFHNIASQLSLTERITLLLCGYGLVIKAGWKASHANRYMPAVLTIRSVGIAWFIYSLADGQGVLAVVAAAGAGAAIAVIAYAVSLLLNPRTTPEKVGGYWI